MVKGNPPKTRQDGKNHFIAFLLTNFQTILEKEGDGYTTLEHC